MLVISAGINQMLVRLANRKDPDLGMHCLSRPFWQVTSVQNFRTFTVYLTSIATRECLLGNCLCWVHKLFILCRVLSKMSCTLTNQQCVFCRPRKLRPAILIRVHCSHGGALIFSYPASRSVVAQW